MDVVGDMMQKLAEEAGEEVSNEVKARAGAGAGGNWLVALAKAMGDVAGKHLANAVNLAGKISSMEDLQPTGNETQDAADRSNQAREMSSIQAQMQAENQMFKLAQEASSTLLKTIGESLSTAARKQ